MQPVLSNNIKRCSQVQRRRRQRAEQQSERYITATVIRVLPNGNLLIKAKSGLASIKVRSTFG